MDDRRKSQLAALDQDETATRNPLLTPEGLMVFNDLQARRKGLKAAQKRLQEDQKRGCAKARRRNGNPARGGKPGLLTGLAAGIGVGVSAVPAGRQATRSAQPERGPAADAAGDALPFDGAAVEETQRSSAAYVGGGAACGCCCSCSFSWWSA